MILAAFPRSIRYLTLLVVATVLVAGCAGHTTKPTVGTTTATLNAVGSCANTDGNGCWYYMRIRRVGTSSWINVFPWYASKPGHATGVLNKMPWNVPVVGLSAGTTYEYQACGKEDSLSPGIGSPPYGAGSGYECGGPDGTSNTTQQFTTAGTSEPTVDTIQAWKSGADPAAWAGGKVYYNVPNASGVFDGYSANPDGSDVTCVTCSGLYPGGTQHAISDATPDGKYLLTTVEEAGHPASAIAAQGAGAWNDLWLQSSDGTQAWKLTNALASGTSALIWPRFDATGTRVVWAEQWKWGVPFGGWRLHVAQLTWTNGVPSLTNEVTFQSTGLLEPYGFSPDGTKVVFAADALAGSSWDDLQIMTISSDLTGTATRVSPQDASDTGWFSNYNEFAFPLPGTSRIIFGRSVGAFLNSLEYWTMNWDGSDPQQLTWLSIPWSVQYQGYPSVVSGVAFNSANPKQFIVGVGQSTSQPTTYKSFLLTLK